MATLNAPVPTTAVYSTLAKAKAAYAIGDVYTRTIKVVTNNSSGTQVTTNYTYTQTVEKYVQDIYGNWHVECKETRVKQ